MRARKFFFFVAAIGYAIAWLPAAAAAPQALVRVSAQSVAAAVASPPSSLFVSDYTLNPSQPFVRTLQSYAQSGRPLFIVLSGEGFAYTVRQNCAIVASFTNGQCSIGGHHTGFWRRGNVAVYLTPYPMHAKVLMIGNRAVVLTDENDAEGGYYYAIPVPIAPPLLSAILHGGCQSIAYITCDKTDALHLESHIIAQAKSSIVLSTESFSSGNAVSDALVAALRRRVHVSIVVAAREYQSTPREREFLKHLQGLGAKVSISQHDHKYLIVDGSVRWAGSANASAGLGNQIEWSLGL